MTMMMMMMMITMMMVMMMMILIVMNIMVTMLQLMMLAAVTAVSTLSACTILVTSSQRQQHTVIDTLTRHTVATFTLLILFISLSFLFLLAITLTCTSSSSTSPSSSPLRSSSTSYSPAPLLPLLHPLSLPPPHPPPVSPSVSSESLTGKMMVEKKFNNDKDFRLAVIEGVRLQAAVHAKASKSVNRCTFFLPFGLSTSPSDTFHVVYYSPLAPLFISFSLLYFSALCTTLHYTMSIYLTRLYHFSTM